MTRRKYTAVLGRWQDCLTHWMLHPVDLDRIHAWTMAVANSRPRHRPWVFHPLALHDLGFEPGAFGDHSGDYHDGYRRASARNGPAFWNYTHAQLTHPAQLARWLRGMDYALDARAVEAAAALVTLETV